MNAADLARLELAKRAYRAVEPSTAEVQRGVRKARLSLRRPRQRRAWFSKTLIAVVLAMGGLAYAKPHALGEWVESTLRSAKSVAPKRAGGAGAPAAAALSPKPAAGPAGPKAAGAAEARVAGPAEQQAPLPAASEPALGAPVLVAPKAPPAHAAQGDQPSASAVSPTLKAQAAAPSAVAGSGPEPASSESNTASEWGRVGEALARGDEPRALAALKELGQSEDPRTRDKADLGRAQLLMANGHRDQACTMARNLTNRRAGSRIERQAQALLKSCARDNH